jgi:hypothetical protein
VSEIGWRRERRIVLQGTNYELVESGSVLLRESTGMIDRGDKYIFGIEESVHRIDSPWVAVWVTLEEKEFPEICGQYKSVSPEVVSNLCRLCEVLDILIETFRFNYSTGRNLICGIASAPKLFRSE